MSWTREYHIHVDAEWIDPAFERELITDRKYNVQDFIHRDGEASYAPQRHLTFKISDASVFRQECAWLFKRLEKDQPIRGYVEAECAGPKFMIAEKPYSPHLPAPFTVEMQQLGPGKFREAELHFTFDKERSSPEAISALQDCGMYSAFTEKSYGLAQILTIQGRRSEMRNLLEVLRVYLGETGGFTRASIMEERITRFWLSDPHVQRPPVVRTVSFPT